MPFDTIPEVDSFDHYLSRKVEQIKSTDRLRELKLPQGFDFSSNDYLCLSSHPVLKKKIQEAVELYGCGSTSSRLVRGHRNLMEQMESEFASWVGSENALFVANGYNANVGFFSSLGPDTVVFTDRLNHASILDGIRLSGADRIYYRHLDVQDLEEKIKKAKIGSKKRILVTEALFSMNGDIAPLKELVEISETYGLVLVVDEAHSLGVFGDLGNGLVSAYGLENKVDVRIFTMGKSMGLEGALISGKQILKDYLINTMRSFIFSTAPMPAVAAGILAAIGLVKNMQQERLNLLKNAKRINNELIDLGYDTLNSVSHIIPVIAGSEQRALAMSRFLEERGFDIRAIRPPTVETSRLRLSIHSCHSKNELDHLMHAFALMVEKI